jgi:hypothetical protein
LGIPPFPGLVCSDVSLVLVICRDQLNFRTGHLTIEFVNRHLSSHKSTIPGYVRINTGHIGQQADPYDAVANLSGSR